MCSFVAKLFKLDKLSLDVSLIVFIKLYDGMACANRGGWANKTPWYMMPLISMLTTREESGFV